METDERYQLTSPDQVTEILGTPLDFVVAKLGDHIDESAAQFISQSPLAFLATHDRDGRTDVSPKGDAPGFVHVIDSTTLLIPERKGNNLAEGIRNIIDTGWIGMIFVVPGQRETLRVNGTATMSNDPSLLDRLAAHGKPSLLCTTVSVEECFFHCGKAMIRSKVWNPDTWSESTDSPFAKQAATTMGAPEIEPQIAAALEQNYIDDLY
jgi:PPOX class probable FMN-dependent enzyme